MMSEDRGESGSKKRMLMSHWLYGTCARAVVGLGVAFAVSSTASEDQQTFNVRLLGLDGLEGAWLGTAGDDAVDAEWTFSDNGNFRVPVPASKRMTLLALAKDRQPEIVRVVPDTASGFWTYASPRDSPWMAPYIRSTARR